VAAQEELPAEVRRLKGVHAPACRPRNMDTSRTRRLQNRNIRNRDIPNKNNTGRAGTTCWKCRSCTRQIIPFRPPGPRFWPKGRGSCPRPVVRRGDVRSAETYRAPGKLFDGGHSTPFWRRMKRHGGGPGARRLGGAAPGTAFSSAPGSATRCVRARHCGSSWGVQNGVPSRERLLPGGKLNPLFLRWIWSCRPAPLGSARRRSSRA
jgi:hypothetical protein